MSQANDAPELPGGILRFTLPMPPPLGHVHVWLIPTGNGWAMFDAGFPSPQGVDKLETQIQPLLCDGRRLEAVFISHYHPDHTAFAGRLQHAFGCDVYIHEADWQRMQLIQEMRESDDGSGDTYRRRFSGGWAESLNDHEFEGEQSSDARDSMFSKMREAMQDIDLPMPEPSLLQGGETIEIGGRQFEAIWTPGHTEGHLCVRDVDQNALFTGDHLLGRITPHIGMWPDQERSPLPDFERSLGLVQELNASIALPAHEAIIEHPAERAIEILEHHQVRRQDMLNAVAEGNQTVKDIAIRTFPKRAKDRMQLTMAMSETVAHLEALVEENELTRSGERAERCYLLV
jgi:glyoxylase-like metal-dependent hydrolase (beta-lactamase superfamily II)